MFEAPKTQVPAVYRRRIGEVIVTAISDGYVTAAYEMMRQITLAEAEALLRGAFRPASPRISVNCFVIHSQGRVGIIDSGGGISMGDQCGHLPAHLQTAGIAPADIDTVILTHMHPDHSNGLTSVDGQANFANAELVVSETDVAHWHDDAAMSMASERHRERFFMGARHQSAPPVRPR